MSPRHRLIAWYVPGVGALAAMPFVAPVLADRGFTDPEIARLMALGPLATLIAAPAWAALADRTGAGRAILVTLTVLSALAMAALATPTRGLAIVAIVALYAITRAPQGPLVDAAAVSALGDAPHAYGQLRLWGSAAFLVVAVANGALRDHWGPAPMVTGAALLAAAAAAAAALPAPPRATAPPLWRAATRSLASRDMALLLLACTLHGVGLAFYNAFLGRHVEALGLPASVTGAALAVAVGVEIAVMALTPALLKRTSASSLLVLALAVSAPRWWATGQASAALPLIATQALHGLSFGLFWAVAVPAFAQRAPAGLRRSAQALLPASAFGVGPLLGLGVASLILEHHPTSTLFTAGAATSVLATLAALALRPSGLQGEIRVG